jgi:hypothetical protein
MAVEDAMDGRGWLRSRCSGHAAVVAERPSEIPHRRTRFAAEGGEGDRAALDSGIEELRAAIGREERI